jgi:hypothetical protein
VQKLHVSLAQTGQTRPASRYSNQNRQNICRAQNISPALSSNLYMKKLLLVPTVLIGIAAASQAQAGGLNLHLNLPLPPLLGLVVSHRAPVAVYAPSVPVCEPSVTVSAPVCDPAPAVVCEPAPVFVRSAPVIIERPHVYYGRDRFDHDDHRLAYNNSWNGRHDVRSNSNRGDHRR